jgi:MFS family permease
MDLVSIPVGMARPPANVRIVLGPVIGGFVTQYKGWRWTNWVVLIAAGFAFGLLCMINETYSPALLQKKANALRKQENEDRYYCRYDQKLGFVDLMKTNLSRPFVMAVKEPICIFWNVYIAIIYGQQ